MYDRSFMIKLVKFKMPFGQYEGWYITDLPVHYLEWFNRQGFPDGVLGQYLSTVYEVKLNGLDDVIEPIKKKYRYNNN